MLKKILHEEISYNFKYQNALHTVAIELDNCSAFNGYLYHTKINFFFSYFFSCDCLSSSISYVIIFIFQKNPSRMI